MTNPIKYSILFLSLSLFFASCSSLDMMQARNKIEGTYGAGNYKQSLSTIEKLKDDGVYRSKDEVLYQLEKGTAAHFSGEYNSSIEAYLQAEERMDELVTRSVSRAIASVVGNDNQLDYDGEDYEQIYVNSFNSLNFAKQNDLEGALVEIRKISFKLAELESRYKGLAESLQKQKNFDKIRFDKDERERFMSKPKYQIRNSSFSRWLSTLFYAKAGDVDDARIERERLDEALIMQESLANGLYPTQEDLDILQDPSAYNVALVAFSGRSPIKQPVDLRSQWNKGSYDDPDYVYVKFSFPVLVDIPSDAAYVKAVIGDTLEYDVPRLENMDEVAKQMYAYKQPTIYMRAVLRSIAKTIGTEQINKKAEKESDFLGGLSSILTTVYKEASEQADLRSWTTLPAKAYGQIIQLPEGTHHIVYEYYSYGGRLIYTQSDVIEIKPQSTSSQLQISESLYWN